MGKARHGFSFHRLYRQVWALEESSDFEYIEGASLFNQKKNWGFVMLVCLQISGADPVAWDQTK